MNKKTSSAIAFTSGDYVVYPAHGVGKVSDISKQKIAGSELDRKSTRLNSSHE